MNYNYTEYWNFNEGKTIKLDLKYHKGTDSGFWLAQCNGFKELRVNQEYFFLGLKQGNLKLFDTPSDYCTEIETIHNAPDGSEVKTSVFIKMVDSSII